MIVTAAQVRAAHGDAWQAEGTLRRAFGGGVTTVRGARLMASGIDHPQWNNADVDDPAAADIDAMREWYAGIGVPWGVRVPAGAAWRHGRFLFRKRLMGLALGGGVAASPVPGVVVRRARAEDLDGVLHVDVIGFEVADAGLERKWIEPHLDVEHIDVALAELDGEPVGTGYALRSDGRADLRPAGLRRGRRPGHLRRSLAETRQGGSDLGRHRHRPASDAVGIDVDEAAERRRLLVFAEER